MRPFVYSSFNRCMQHTRTDTTNALKHIRYLYIHTPLFSSPLLPHYSPLLPYPPTQIIPLHTRRPKPRWQWRDIYKCGVFQSQNIPLGAYFRGVLLKNRMNTVIYNDLLCFYYVIEMYAYYICVSTYIHFILYCLIHAFKNSLLEAILQYYSMNYYINNCM